MNPLPMPQRLVVGQTYHLSWASERGEWRLFVNGVLQP